MSTLTEVVDGLETRLKTITALSEVYDFSPGSPVFPAAVIVPPDTVSYHEAMGGGLVQLDFTVLVLVSASVDSNQSDLLAYRNGTGASSVKAAIEGDKTLGLSDTNAVVMQSQSAGKVEIPGGDAWGASFTVIVRTKGT